ncbi:MAG: hypothetical protein WBX25_08805 [Rhodomicrobium sp.]
MNSGQVFASLVIGFVAKRDLGASEAAVTGALAKAYDLLDKRYPHSPKILVNALAAGADTIAARNALTRAVLDRCGPSSASLYTRKIAY